VASLLKLYLRELPEPLVPFSRYEEFLICGKRIPSDREKVSSTIALTSKKSTMLFDQFKQDNTITFWTFKC